MQNAPPVSYPVGRRALYAVALAVLWSAGVLTLGLWVVSVDSLSWRQGLVGLAVWVVGGVAWYSWRTFPRGELRWTGLVWTWTALTSAPTLPTPIEGGVVVHLDWQQGLLLRFKPSQGRHLWLCLLRSTAFARWHDLRRAVYSRFRTKVSQLPLPSRDKRAVDLHTSR